MAIISFEKSLAKIGKELDEAMEVALSAGAATALSVEDSSAPLKKKKKKAPPPMKPFATMDQVRDSLRRVIQVGGNDACSGILKTFGVNKVSNLDPAEWDKVIEASETYLDLKDKSAE